MAVFGEPGMIVKSATAAITRPGGTLYWAHEGQYTIKEYGPGGRLGTTNVIVPLPRASTTSWPTTTSLVSSVPITLSAAVWSTK